MRVNWLLFLAFPSGQHNEDHVRTHADAVWMIGWAPRWTDWIWIQRNAMQWNGMMAQQRGAKQDQAKSSLLYLFASCCKLPQFIDQ